jgi:hypothetical protein
MPLADSTEFALHKNNHLVRADYHKRISNKKSLQNQSCYAIVVAFCNKEV